LTDRSTTPWSPEGEGDEPPGTRTSTGGGNKEGAERWEEGGHTWMVGSGRRRGRPARRGAERREVRGKIKIVFFYEAWSRGPYAFGQRKAISGALQYENTVARNLKPR
jgi:hypothetical protein